MTDHRFIDISDEAMRVRLASGRLRVERRGRPGEAEGNGSAAWTAPLDDIDAVILAHEGSTVSSLALAGLAKAGCGVVACDEKRLPVGMLIPLTGHSSQAERFRAQAAAPIPLRKRMWQALIKAKIRNQATLLRDLNGDDEGLAAMANRVRSGDPDNREAQAAQRYWKAIFRNRTMPFRRDRGAEDENAMLNYGYAVLRASTARALCAAGLHPGLGIHHHNRYDAYCLADDAMEPFRPLVDGVVAVHGRKRREEGAPLRVDSNFKQTLIMELGSRLLIDGEWRTLFDVLARVSGALASMFLEKRSILSIPYLRSPLLGALLNDGGQGREKTERRENGPGNW